MEAAAYYWKVVWAHDAADDPVVLYHELDAERREVRKVEVYADGRIDRADANAGTGSTRLSDVPLPPAEEIQAQSEFELTKISITEFEAMWNAASGR